MSKLSDIDPEAALSAMEGEESQDQPAPEIDDTPAPESDSAIEAKQTTEAQAIADLSKFKEVTIDGHKMTYDELRSSIMRQQDYTRKTQEVAEQRKYYDNVHADLDRIRKEPQLAAEFKKIYPAQFHRMLDLVLQGQTPQQAQQQTANLPPEIMERLDRTEQSLAEYQQEKLKAQQESLNAQMETIENKMASKYKYADRITVYTLAEQRREQLEREAGQKLRPEDINEKFLEPFFKASHDHQLKQYNTMQKDLAQKAKSSHAEGSDIGRGGGTPDAPAAKLNFKRGGVADYILEGGDI